MIVEEKTHPDKIGIYLTLFLLITNWIEKKVEWMGSNMKSYRRVDHLIHTIIILILCASFFFMTMNPIQATSNDMIHNNITGNKTDPGCVICHTVQGKQLAPEPDQFNKPSLKKTGSIARNSSILQVVGNYTTILEVGQTNNQIGPFLRNTGDTGGSWWDNSAYNGEFHFGTDIERNLITLMVLNYSEGTMKPVKGLVNPPTYPQVTRRNHSANYSYKADTTDPTLTYRWDPTGTIIVYAENHYEDGKDLWMVKEVNLTEVTSANLTFWTWYLIETDWDYGFVGVSTDLGVNWANLPGTLTTNTNPYGNNPGNGITGNSNGWVQESMNLTPFSGKNILLRFRFISDVYVNDEGWYIDDINITSGSTSILFDDAETPAIIKTLNVNVSYPHLVIGNLTDPLTSAANLEYVQHTQQVDLTENLKHPGTYSGYFIFNSYTEPYSGNYTVMLDTMIDGMAVSATTQFQATIYGCQGCHNKKTDINGTNFETSFIHQAGGFCTYECHSGSRGFYDGGSPGFSPWLDSSPMHLHEIQYGHRGGNPTYYPPVWIPYDVPGHVTTVKCTQCHTSFVHDNTGSDTATIGNYTLYGTNITFSSGTHANLTCEYCHGDLSYPVMSGNQYQLHGTIGSYKPAFTSHISFTDTYMIAVNGTQDLSVTITGENSTNVVRVYMIGPVDNYTSGLQANPYLNSRILNAPINMYIGNPSIGTWLIKFIQMDDGLINYTISSNYPLQKKPIIKIPECNSCHNSAASGKDFTIYEIPDWNPGFAHADTNKDGVLDVQCRMCHDSMHGITTKDCHNCHTTAPVNHPIKEPVFGQYTQSQCLVCHGDPHRITSAGGTGCIACHVPGDVNTSKFARHADINTTGGTGNVTNNDCWTCHYQKDMSRSHVYLCESCHQNSGGIVPVNDPVLIVNNLQHGSNTCKSCHAPNMYHFNGTTGPLGKVEKLGWH